MLASNTTVAAGTLTEPRAVAFVALDAAQLRSRSRSTSAHLARPHQGTLCASLSMLVPDEIVSGVRSLEASVRGAKGHLR